MKKIILLISVLVIANSCENKKIVPDQIQQQKNVSDLVVQEKFNKDESNFSFKELIASQQSTTKRLKWIAPSYNKSQLGKAKQTDVIKTFGEPKEQFHPFSEYESTKDKWTFYYENINDFDGRISFTCDIRSKILKEVWLRPNDKNPLTIEDAIETYGDEYFLRKIGKDIYGVIIENE